jgi:hypothetical protein
LVFILDENFIERLVSVTLQGKTPVKVNDLNNTILPAPTADFKCTRVYRMNNNNSSSYTGNVYCTEGNAITNGLPDNTADVRAYIFDGNNQTLMSQYTVPGDKYGALLGANTSLINKQSQAADITTWARLFEKVFVLANTTGLNTVGTTSHRLKPSLPIVLPPKTDIVFRASASGAIGASGNFGILLIDKKNVNRAGELL